MITRTLQRFQFDSLVINGDDSTPIFRQLEEQLRNAITQQRLLANERLPSTRKLSQQLRISRNTVINAYEQLTNEGYIVTAHGSGTRVNPHALNNATECYSNTNNNKKKIDISHTALIASQADNIVPKADGGSSRAFRAHTPACKEFPSTLWAQLMSQRLRSQADIWLERNHPCGYTPLRQAISGYLGASRGINASSDEVIITAGTQQSIDLLAKLLINEGDIVCFEEPGYTPASTVFEMAGASIRSIPVDNEGISIDYLEKYVPEAKVIYVTPSSHFPLGMCMSLERRNALLKWAKKNDTIIIEDDYNGEYRYQGNPLPSLQTLATSQHVIYLGSFSKLLFPALRLGYMLVPAELINAISTLRWLIDRHSPTLEQAVLTDFIDLGHFARHLRRMRHLYSQRQKALVEAANIYLTDIMQVPPLPTGLHLIGWLNHGVAENDVLLACEKASIEVMACSRFSALPTERPSVILGYAPYTEEVIHEGIKAIADAWETLSVK
ncbi:hypothetical protein A9Q99_27315 [Gammaproteobacteria bacterium 45_16_T64]|nr:hypothetical protein A9Q99_27315 [Gammaproteobacteria bacterium 45_16_T64]